MLTANRLDEVEVVQHLLMQLPDVLDLYVRRDPRFIEQTQKWILEVQTILRALGAVQAAVVATERGALELAIRRQSSLRGPEGQRLRASDRSYATAGAAIAALRAVEAAARTAIQPALDLVGEAESLARKTVAVASFKGLLGGLPTSGSELVQAILADSDTQCGYVAIVGLVGVDAASKVLRQAAGRALGAV